jgi:hypothetical protein
MTAGRRRERRPADLLICRPAKAVLHREAKARARHNILVKARSRIPSFKSPWTGIRDHPDRARVTPSSLDEDDQPMCTWPSRLPRLLRKP